jgi:hypothetical protein
MMTKILDLRKQSDWRKRLKKFRSSGQTVDRFCQLEKVTPSAFYYWSRRFRQAEQELPSASQGRRCRNSEASGLATKDSEPSTVGAQQPASMVHFTWNSSLQVSIPVHCLDAIRSVLEWAHERVEESPNASANSFQQVIASSR